LESAVASAAVNEKWFGALGTVDFGPQSGVSSVTWGSASADRSIIASFFTHNDMKATAAVMRYGYR
jgi:hypothetical protein